MQVSDYQPSYLDLVIMLHETYHETFIIDDLPPIGFICMEGAIPVAVGFLKPNGTHGMVEHLVVNQYLPIDMQIEGRGLVVKAITERCKSLNLKTIY
jgi:hypothetical protein